MIVILTTILLPAIFTLPILNINRKIALDQSRTEQDFANLQLTVGDFFILTPRHSESRSEILLMKPQDADVLLKFPSLSQTESAAIDHLQSGEKIEIKVLKKDFESASQLSLWKKFINFFTDQAEKMVLVYRCKVDENNIFERPNDYPNAVNRYSHVNQMQTLKLSFIPLLLIAALIGKIRRTKSKQHPLQGK